MTERIGEFEVLAVLGVGGQATTLRATDGQRVVALKVFATEDADVAQREAALMAQAAHPGVARFEGLVRGHWRGAPVIAVAQEFIDGASLQAIIDDKRLVSEDDLISIARQLLTIAGKLHSHDPPIVHRDIKPANIIVTPEGRLYLVDFGGGLTVDEQGEVVGTLGYTAPEQFFGEVEPRSDLYSIGATLLHLATRRHPSEFPMRDLRYELEGRLACGPPLDSLIERLLDPSADARPADANLALQLIDSPPDAGDSAVSVERRPDRLRVRVPPAYHRLKRITAVAAMLSVLSLLIDSPELAVFIVAATILGIAVGGYRQLVHKELDLTNEGWELTQRLLGRTWTRRGPIREGFGLRHISNTAGLHDFENLIAPFFGISASPREAQRIQGAIEAFVADADGQRVQFDFSEHATVDKHASEESSAERQTIDAQEVR